MKSNRVRLSAILAFFLLFFLLCYFLFSLFLPWNTTAVGAVPWSQSELPLIILDAGHGGMDGGASSDDQTLEKDLNLFVTLLLRDFLESAGIPTLLTRQTDTMLDTESQKGTRKMRDLKARLEIAQKHPQAVFVSIHMNHFPQSQYHGLQVYYSPNHKNSELLALTVQNFNKLYLQPENQRLCKAADSSIYLLHRMENVGILVECGFLSNAQETQQLKTEAYRRQLAFTLFCSIIEYCNLQHHT